MNTISKGDIMLALLGFLCVVVMLVLVMTKKASPVVALIATPIVFGILASFFIVTDPEAAPGVVNFAANLKELGKMITGPAGILLFVLRRAHRCRHI